MVLDELVQRVSLHLGGDAALARAALDASLAALAPELGRPEAELLADALPPGVGASLRGSVYAGLSADRAEIEARVAEESGVAHAVAAERFVAVCRALAERLPEDVRLRVTRALDPSVAALLAPPDEPTLLEPHPHASRHTLADGRPGSTRPLNEARPDRTQAGSVASANPHGDTKLSSARGLTQEREAESLASGHPGSDRPLGDAKR